MDVEEEEEEAEEVETGSRDEVRSSRAGTKSAKFDLAGFPCDVQLWGRRRTEVTKIEGRMGMDIDVEEEGKRRCKRDRGMLCCLPGRAKKCEVRFGWCCL